MKNKARAAFYKYGSYIPFLRPRLQKRARSLALQRWLSEGSGKMQDKQSAESFNLLILNHNYDLDIEALEALSHTKPFNQVWSMPLELFQGCNEFFPVGTRDLDCVYGSETMREPLHKYQEDFVLLFVTEIIERIKPDVLVSPSDLFYWFRPVIEEFQKRGVPVVVQDKEGMLAPGELTLAHANLVRERYPLMADLFLLWSQSHLDFYRLLGVQEERALIVGQPRSDFFFHPERWPSKEALGLDASKPLVLAFTFAADAYVEMLPAGSLKLKNGYKPWTQLRIQFHRQLLRFARENPEFEVVVKAHPQQWDLEQARKEVMAEQLPNVHFWSGAATASHLIVNAQVIVGFQTTALFESMLLDKFVIYAGWMPEVELLSDKLLLLPQSGGLEVPRNEEEFFEMLTESIREGNSVDSDKLEARRTIADTYFCADGNVARRVLNTIVDFLDARKASHAED